MDGASEHCATLLSDARCDVRAYVCLIGIMARGAGNHKKSEAILYGKTVENGGNVPVVTSVDAIVRSLDRLDASDVTLIAPYVEERTQTVINDFESTGFNLVDYETLECPDNFEVAQLAQRNLINIVSDLNNTYLGALMLSSRVQMPWLAANRRPWTDWACRCFGGDRDDLLDSRPSWYQHTYSVRRPPACRGPTRRARR